MASITSQSSLDIFIKSPERDLMLKDQAKSKASSCYAIVIVGTIQGGDPENKFQRVFATVMGEGAVGFQTSTMPRISQNLSVKKNAKDIVLSVQPLLTKESNESNVVVDIIGQRIFSDNQEILNRYEALGLDKNFKFNLVQQSKWDFIKGTGWKHALKDILIRPIQLEAETCKINLPK
jgi:hypothetical protein